MKNTEIFDCKKCGDCCKGYGGTFVTEQDIKAISAYLKQIQKPLLKIIVACPQASRF